MNPVDIILPRLDKVKSTGASKWKARCPAHDDRDPSLSIREASDGKVLVHCWAGCTATEITAAVGLDLSELFPADSRRAERKGPSKAAIEHERRIVTIALSLLAQGVELPPSDLGRLETARRRLAQLEASQ